MSLEGATDDPVVADIRNFYEAELWTPDDRIERMLYAETSLAGVLRIRHQRVLQQWPMDYR